MNKRRCIAEYRRIFKDVPMSKVIPFRSPCDGNLFKLERVNPDHVGFIWGKTKKKPYRFSRFAKIYFTIFPIALYINVANWLMFYTGYVFNVVSSIGLLTVFLSFMVACLYYFPLYLNIKKAGVVCG